MFNLCRLLLRSPKRTAFYSLVIITFLSVIGTTFFHWRPGTSFMREHCHSPLQNPNILHKSVHDLQRIRTSVKQELNELEQERLKRIYTKFQLNNEMEQLTVEYNKRKQAVDVMKATLESLAIRHMDLKKQLEISPNKPLDFSHLQPKYPTVKAFPTDYNACSMEVCWYWAQCPLSQTLLYSILRLNTSQHYLISHFHGKLLSNISLSSHCILFIPSCDATLQSLCLHFHVNCIFLCTKDPVLQSHFISHFPIVHHLFLSELYRPGYDVILPAQPSFAFSRPVVASSSNALHRKYLILFCTSLSSHSNVTSFNFGNIQNIFAALEQQDSKHYHFVFQNKSTNVCFQEQARRIQWLSDSDFCLLLPPKESNVISNEWTQKSLMECLLAGSVPLLLGSQMHLPFEEIIPLWNQAVLRIPLPRIVEMDYILKSIEIHELLEMRRLGRIIWERYIGSEAAQAAALKLIFTRRMGLPLPHAESHPAEVIWPPPPLMDGSVQYSNVKTYEVNSAVWQELDDYLGPLDSPMPSEKWMSLTGGGKLTNMAANSAVEFALHGRGGDPDPFRAYPFTPWSGYASRGEWFGAVSLLPGLQYSFRPIDHSVNSAGQEFSKSLGGNRPYEQFTVVFLGHSRLHVLMSSVELMKDLPYLNSVLIVWNGDPKLLEDVAWPKLHVPLHVVKGLNNSLNNRFIPYHLIETEAVLSLDDDVQMRQDEIILAFRVWRQHPDQIVGFPARYHQRVREEESWMYNSNYTCEYSLILTGAAFLHSYYYYLYTDVMSPSIRAMVDNKMNCEDLAMNFLVSHITRKSPIKVTSRWTFACAECKNSSLHLKNAHYDVRSWCINELANIYGYNPLLYSQYRVDSVLFKTRLPLDKQKCFKYV